MPLNDIRMTESSFAEHEVDEWFQATLDRVEEAEDYGYGDTVRFVFTIDGEESETWGLASQKLSPQSKLYKWINGIDPSAVPEVGQVIDWDRIVGREVEVMFERNKEGVVRPSKFRTAKTGKPGAIQKKQQAATRAKTVTGDDSPF